MTAERKTRLKELKKARDAAKKEHQEKVSSCEEAVDQAISILSGHVVTLGKITLYGDRVVADGTTIRLSKDIEAEVSTSGQLLSHTTVKSKGPNIAGAVIGDVLAGPTGAIIGGQKKIKSESKVEDARKLYVSIVSDDGNAVVEVDPKKELEARKLVAEIKSQARSYEQRKKESEVALSKATDDLEKAQADTEKMDKAEKEYSEYKNDTHVVDEAKAKHEAFVASFDKDEIAREKKAVRKRTISKIIMIIDAIIGAFFVLLGVDMLTAILDGAPAGVIILLIADVLLVRAWMRFNDMRSASKASEQ